MRTTNLAVLAVRGGARDRVQKLVEGRGGTAYQEVEGLPVFGFTSPTDAVLAGLDLAGAEEPSCAAITAGEVQQGEAAIEGRAVEAAAELAASGPSGEVLLVDAVFFAMNRNEVSATLMDDPPANVLGQKVYLGAVCGEAEPGPPPPAPASAPAPAPGGGQVGAPWMVLLVLLAFGGGTMLARAPAGLGGADLGARAAELAAKGQHREAAHAFFEAYLEDPGQPRYEARFREELLTTVQGFLDAGRPDAAYALLADAQERDPFRTDVEQRLEEVGLTYLERLLENGSRDAFEREKVRLIERLPLREQAIRDQVVSVHVRRLVVEWQAAKHNRKRSEIAGKTGPLWSESPNNPDLLLAEAEFAAGNSRYEMVRDFLSRAFDRRPEFAREREEVPRILIRSFRSMANTYTRSRNLEETVAFAAQRVGKPMVGPARAALESDAVGERNGAYLLLERLGELSDAEALGVHERNLTGVRHVDAREGPLEDPMLIGWAIDFTRRAQGATRRRMLELLEGAQGQPGLKGEQAARLRDALEELK